MSHFRTGKTLNVIVFNINWFFTAYTVVQGWSYIAVGLILLTTLGHVILSREKIIDSVLYAVAPMIGFCLDTFLVKTGVLLTYEEGPFGKLSPLFMAALWINFATTLPHSLNWIAGRYRWGAILGGVGGPLAYYGGVPYRTSLVWVGVEWAFALPLLLWLYAMLKRWFSKT